MYTLWEEVSVLSQEKGGVRNRGGRPRLGRELLSRERILGAALRVVDEEGMGALSMRRLGAELSLPVFLYGEVGGGRGPAFFRRGGTEELNPRS